MVDYEFDEFAGSYFCYDNPGALQDNFKTDLNMSTSKFVLLYSIYSWPNVILCFVGGFLLDRVFGIRWGTIIFMSLTLVGQMIFALGAYIDAFWLMMVGRFVFGYVSIMQSISTLYLRFLSTILLCIIW